MKIVHDAWHDFHHYHFYHDDDDYYYHSNYYHYDHAMVWDFALSEIMMFY